MTMLAEEAWKERLKVGCWQALKAGLEAWRVDLRSVFAAEERANMMATFEKNGGATACQRGAQSASRSTSIHRPRLADKTPSCYLARKSCVLTVGGSISVMTVRCVRDSPMQGETYAEGTVLQPRWHQKVGELPAIELQHVLQTKGQPRGGSEGYGDAYLMYSRIQANEN